MSIRREARAAAAGAGPDANAPNPSGSSASADGLPPFHLLAGESARLSGSLKGMDRSVVRFAPSWQTALVVMPRGSVQSIVQRPGEARVLADSFETLDPARWSITGGAAAVARPGPGGGRCLGLPAEGASASRNLEEPLAAGRLELSFQDDGAIARGCETAVEAAFRSASGRAVIRIILGSSEEGLAVESSPVAPSLQIQRLARSPGWHRLSVRFGPDETEIAVDGRELAHGRGPDGPLTAISLATHASNAAAAARFRPAHLDDLLLIRFVEPPASVEIDATQDEARIVLGDQIFGEIREADPDGVVMAVGGRTIPLRWGDVAGLYLRRVPAQGTAIEGLLVRAEWRAAPGERASDIDRAEGALVALSDQSLTLATPYAGTLTIPRGPLGRLDVLGRGRRIVLDVAAHHLGDEISVTQPLDPPHPEGLSLNRTIELPAAPDQPAELVLDVVQVVPEAGDSEYSLQVRNGELRTYVSVNGRRIDYLNRHIKTRNEAPERIRIPVPAGLLRAGKNTIRIELTGDSDPHPKFDDLGILQIAMEFPAAGAGTRAPGPGAAPARTGSPGSS